MASPTSLVFALAAVLVSDAGTLFPNGLAPIETGAPDRASAKACVGCHATAHADWAASRHGLAWTNATFQREYRDRPLDWCVHCHAPLREQLAEVRRGGGPLANEGVSCAACHIREGRVLSRARSPASPHDTDVRSDFGGPAYCGGCHQFNFPKIEADTSSPKAVGRVTGYTAYPMQATVAQHKTGPRSREACLTCHRAGAGGHAFPGGHDAAMIGRALTVDFCRYRGALEVRLANTGAGHNVPTGDLHRHLVLRVWRASAPERLRETVLGRSFEPAPDGGKRTVADDTIPAGVSRAARFELPALGPAASVGEPISIEVRLVYTIDEFPFRGRELGEPTFSTMFKRDLNWQTLPRCLSRRP